MPVNARYSTFVPQFPPLTPFFVCIDWRKTCFVAPDVLGKICAAFSEQRLPILVLWFSVCTEGRYAMWCTCDNFSARVGWNITHWVLVQHHGLPPLAVSKTEGKPTKMAAQSPVFNLHSTWEGDTIMASCWMQPVSLLLSTYFQACNSRQLVPTFAGQCRVMASCNTIRLRTT